MVGDQGGPFSYPGDYFSAEAPEKYKIKGSFGHPVPVVDGKTQSSGAKASAIVLKKEFTDVKDLLSIDYTSAYSTPVWISWFALSSMTVKRKVALLWVTNLRPMHLSGSKQP